MTSGTSVALIVEGTESPAVVWIPAPPANSNRSVAATVHRMVATAEGVLDSVLRGGKPTLVVMMKPLCGDIHQDPSGPRRVGLSFEIARRLVDTDVRVAEVPPMTLNKWILGDFQAGKKGQEAVERAVRDLFPGIDTEGLNDKFRWSTVGLAAAGCLAAGIETRLDVTDARLKNLRPMVLPSTWTLPATAVEWHSKHSPLEVSA
ncbi:hypothetical protein [Mycobacteroides abscessus]|uniref:hypothetical protein n=1 Tax=Mycobacteroides abscessus TaxID=36809 RepID=UPI0013000B16|nr:hypothetical protein [Mycobacteroides abscessus]MDQ8118517.1 hypothetical protein [Mycobacteroides abscessus subsp. massiliense]